MNAVVSVRHAYDREAFLKVARSRFEAAFGGSGPDSDSFLDQLWGDALADDLAGVSEQDAISLAEEFWRYGADRAADKILIRVRTAHGADGRSLDRDILEVIGQDRPFLVDSVMGEIASQGLDVMAMFHPVVQVRRGEDGERVQSGGRCLNESMIQVHLDLLSDDVRERLEAGVRATLDDVRDAVEDWNNMRAEMDDAIDHTSPTPILPLPRKNRKKPSPSCAGCVTTISPFWAAAPISLISTRATMRPTSPR